jgi:hypothetical protein
MRLVTGDSRFDGHNSLYLVRPCLRHRKAEAARLTVKQQNAGTHLVYQRGIGGDDRTNGGGPAWHDLLGEIVVRLDGKLAAGIYFHLRRVGAP